MISDIGNEGSGLPTEVLSACDEVVYAELADSKGDNYVLNSLNVSVATGEQCLDYKVEQ